jgi:hypothetical protein
MVSRRGFLSGSLAFAAAPALAATRLSPQDVLQQWWGLTLELVRHTANYSPPVASRSFAYLGLIGYLAVETVGSKLESLEGQVPGYVRGGAPRLVFDLARVLHGAFSVSVAQLFDHTGPSGQRAISRLKDKLDSGFANSQMPTQEQSVGLGESIAKRMLEWAKTDGGADVANMGFPDGYKLNDAPGHWKPTSAIRLQQAPLLPNWGKNRTFVVSAANPCVIAAPTPYSEDKASPFFMEAMEVYETVKNISKEQRLIARFWSDDPMLSPTPPGHWMYIALDLLKQRNATIDEHVDLLARLGMALSDSFVVCWRSKFEHDTLRPVTYIKKLIDKTWEPILITPPFPEYPSGHSVQSGAAAEVLSAFFGENFAFEDKTHVREKLPVRKFASFRAAAQEAAISRLYGGIHFRAACERGLEQGRCVGLAVNALRTKSAA